MKQIMMIMVMMISSLAFCGEAEIKNDVQSKLNQLFNEEMFNTQGEFDWNKLFVPLIKGYHVDFNKPYEFNLWGNIKFYTFFNDKKNPIEICNEKFLEYNLYVYNDKLQAVYFTMYHKGERSQFSNKGNTINQFGFDENSFQKIKTNMIKKMTKMFGEPLISKTIPLSISSWEYENYTLEVETGVESSFITFNIINRNNQVKIPSNWKEIVKKNYKNRSIKDFYYIPQKTPSCAAYSRVRMMQYWGCPVNIIEEVYLTYEEEQIGWGRENYSYFSFFKSLYKSPNLMRLNKSYERGFSKFELNYMEEASKYKTKRMNESIEERVAKYVKRGIPCEICFAPGFSDFWKDIAHADNAFSFTKSGKFFSWDKVKVDEEKLNGDARFYAPSDCEVITDYTLVTPF